MTTGGTTGATSGTTSATSPTPGGTTSGTQAGGRVRGTTDRLADGREIIYFDDSEPYVSGRETRATPDTRPLEPALGGGSQLRFDVLTGHRYPGEDAPRLVRGNAGDGCCQRVEDRLLGANDDVRWHLTERRGRPVPGHVQRRVVRRRRVRLGPRDVVNAARQPIRQWHGQARQENLAAHLERHFGHPSAVRVCSRRVADRVGEGQVDRRQRVGILRMRCASCQEANRGDDGAHLSRGRDS